MPPMQWAPRLLVGLVLLGLPLAHGVHAQGGGHPPTTFQGRPLQERLAEADLVVVAEVTGLDAARIALRREDLLKGGAPEVFQVKRPRNGAPPLALGDRAILPLRGARSPYVLVDSPAETILLSGTEAEARWTGALEDMLAHLEDPAEIARMTQEWIDAGPPALRDLGVASLTPLLQPDPDLREAVALERARVAIDPAADPQARAASSLIARQSSAGLDTLIRGMADDAPLDEATLALALRAGAIGNHESLGRLYERALASEEVRIRWLLARETPAALRLGPVAEAHLEDLVENDPDASVRAAAQETLGRLHRRKSPADPR